MPVLGAAAVAVSSAFRRGGSSIGDGEDWMQRTRKIGCLASSGVGEARGSSPTANHNGYQVSVPFEAFVREKLLRLGFCACTFVLRRSSGRRFGEDGGTSGEHRESMGPSYVLLFFYGPLCSLVAAFVSSISSTEASVFVRLHGCFPYRIIQTSLHKKKEGRV